MSAGLKYYLMVFVASACGLIIEIVAGRLLAPTIGVSLYTWTSIIGVVLAGISVGNYLGGRVADRFPSSATLGIILLAGGVASISVLPLVGPISSWVESLPILARILLLTAGLFLLPSLILGMVTPVVVKLRLQSLTRTGNVVGKIYAVSTAGSIFGTFITGFVLIQWVGTRSTVLGVALVLLAMALTFGRPWRARVPALVLMALFAGVGGYGLSTGSLDSGCLRESSYFCIKVTARDIEGRTLRVLTLDQLTHSFVDVDDPTFLSYSYEKVFGDLAIYVGQQNPTLRALFIGGGGYTLPRFIEVTYPRSSLEVIEIDPEVTRVATEYLGLRRDTGIVTYNEDARMAVPRLGKGRYDLVVGDAFNDLSVPYHLTTLEFNEQVRKLLKDDGIYMVNVVDKLYAGKFLRAYVNTLGRTFPYVYVMRDDDHWAFQARYTYVVVGASKPISATSIESANVEAGRGNPLTKIMPRSDFDAWLNGRGTVLLTDDYAPVDNMVASMYLESR